MYLICFKACVFIQTALQSGYVAKAVRWRRASVTDMPDQRSPERQHPGVGKTQLNKKKTTKHNKIFKSGKCYKNAFRTHFLGYENTNVIPLEVISVFLDMMDKTDNKSINVSLSTQP